MRHLARARDILSRIPPGVAAFLAFALLIGGTLALVPFLPPLRDAHAECRARCAPRIGQVVPDKEYPMSARGVYREKCTCS
jgi:hypothetical protein